jgi:hypothetical protein
LQFEEVEAWWRTEKDVAPPHLARPMSEGWILLKTRRAPKESSVTPQSSLAAMGKIVA